MRSALNQMRRSGISAPQKPPLTGLALGSLACLAYIASLSHNYMGDGVQFALEMESGTWQSMLHPNHLLYLPIAKFYFGIWKLLGWSGGALLPLQVLSALAGGLSVGLFYYISRLVLPHSRVPLIIAGGFAVSHGPWLFSTDAEIATVPLAINLVLLWRAMAGASKPSKRAVHAILLGVGAGISILTHQTGVFMGPVIVGAMLTDPRWHRETRWRDALYFVAAAMFTALPVYWIVGRLVRGVQGLDDLITWQFGLSQLGLWGALSIRNALHGMYGFLKTLAGFPGLGPSTRTIDFLAEAGTMEKAAFVAYLLSLLMLASAPFLALMLKPRLLTRHRRIKLLLLLWAAPYAIFAAYWVPGDMQFWVPVLAPWWLSVGIVLDCVGLERGPEPRMVGPSLISKDAHAALLPIGVVAILFAANGLGVILPNRQLERNHEYRVAMDVRELTSADDLLITTGGDRLFLYLPYFAGRETISVFHELLHSDSAGETEVFAGLETKVADVAFRGGSAFLVGVKPGQHVWWDVLATAGLTPQDFRRFQTVPVLVAEGEQILQILP